MARAEEQEYFVKSVTDILHGYGIEVETRIVDIFESLELAKHVSRIIVEEKEKGNQVFVNMSSGNTLSSGVASITAMAHNVKAYYVVADGYSVTNEEKSARYLWSHHQLTMTAISPTQVEEDTLCFDEILKGLPP